MAGNGKGGRDYLDLGDWNAVCSECGRKRKASEMVRNWQGMFRCPEHNEVRHPQEYVRAVPDIQTPPWTQPPSDVFAGVCFPDDITGIADYAVADCAICDYVSPFATPVVPSTTIFVDDFIDTDGTLLVNHVSNSGHSWSGLMLGGGPAGPTFPTTKQIESNQLVSINSDLGLVVPSWVPPSADYYVTARVRFVPGAATTFNVSVGGRLFNDGFGVATGYILEFGYDAFSVNWRMRLYATNLGVLIASTNVAGISLNQYYTILLTMSGSTLSGYLDGVLKVTGTNAAVPGPGLTGLIVYTPRIQVDSMQAEAL